MVLQGSAVRNHGPPHIHKLCKLLQQLLKLSLQATCISSSTATQSGAAKQLKHTPALLKVPVADELCCDTHIYAVPLNWHASL
jgi:hypothetical protein